AGLFGPCAGRVLSDLTDQGVNELYLDSDEAFDGSVDACALRAFQVHAKYFTIGNENNAASVCCAVYLTDATHNGT
ncbi:unnamed protein product, partial [Amoebophrya sp. A120]